MCQGCPANASLVILPLGSDDLLMHVHGPYLAKRLQGTPQSPLQRALVLPELPPAAVPAPTLTALSLRDSNGSFLSAVAHWDLFGLVAVSQPRNGTEAGD